MRFIKYCPLVAGFAIALVACSLKLQVSLFNNAGEKVTIQTVSENISIDPMQSKTVDYPSEGQGWALQISIGECAYTYVVPRTLERYPWSGDSKNVVKVQIEKDLSLYLLPPSSTGFVPVVGLISFQQDGFPLRPIARNCH